MTAALERLRRSYRPERVRLLLVGESPPASGRFFYREDSGLYRAVREAFGVAHPEWGDEEFLWHFQGAGCYLIDLCREPVDRMDPAARRAACIASEPALSREIAKLRPEAIVTVVRSIHANVARAAGRAGWDGVLTGLPYPGRWVKHRREFVEALVRLVVFLLPI